MTVAHKDGQPAAGHLLVCVMADGQAGELIDHGRLLSTSLGIPWRVIYIETVAARFASEQTTQSLTQALQRAGEAQAEILRLSVEIDSAPRIASTIIQQTQSLQATHLLLGNQAMGRPYWRNFGERISDFSEVLAGSLPLVRVHILASPGVPTPRTMQESRLRKTLTRPSPWFGTVRLTLGVLAICTVLSALIAPHLHPINLILIYMVGVLYVALKKDRKAAIATVLLALLIFDWIFVEPRWSLKPTDPEYFFTFAIILCVGLLISHLASLSRQAAQSAMTMAQHSQSLSLLSQNLARAVSLDDIVRAIGTTVERDLGAKAQIVLRDARHDLPPSGPQALDLASSTGRTLPPATGLQGFAMSAGSASVGTLLIQGLSSDHQTASDLHLLQAYANQAAVAIERCRYARQSEQSAIDAETERMRNTLLASISHDFRTPLTTIIGAASALQSQGHAITPVQRQALVQSVLDQASRLQSLSSDLLDMARLQEGKVALHPEWCPAEDLVHDAIASVAAALDQHVVDIQLQNDDVVWCDATLATQALANLLLNASQHAPVGTRIGVQVALDATGCRIVVHDQGPGLKPGSELEVFKKFHREPGRGSDQGTGLGLAICEMVARLHGGRIEARSEGGAVFEITLPQPQRPQLQEAYDA